MPKLTTPLQYEPSIEVLNDIRPLQLADESKGVISYPVLCKNPPTKNRPAVGKLARCSQQGALLARLNKDYTAYELKVKWFPPATPEWVFVFTQKVSFVLCVVLTTATPPIMSWRDPTYSIVLKELDDALPTFIEFVGTYLYIHSNSHPGNVMIIEFYGFY